MAAKKRKKTKKTATVEAPVVVFACKLPAVVRGEVQAAARLALAADGTPYRNAGEWATEVLSAAAHEVLRQYQQ
jgi:hypothetical protein